MIDILIIILLLLLLGILWMCALGINPWRNIIEILKKRISEILEWYGMVAINRKSSLKITDINSDCIEIILEYLNCDDLVNVANTNKQLKSVAETVFKRKYAECVIFHPNSWCRKKISKKTRFLKILHFIRHPNKLLFKEIFSNHCHYAHTMERGLQYLRCFGHLISFLAILNKKKLSTLNPADRYITKYCTKSLERITFDGINEKHFEHIDEPFLNVKVIRFKKCQVGKKLSQFNRWFPKMRHLIIDTCDFIHTYYLMDHFPKLKELAIASSFQEKSERICIEKMLILNKQLTTLQIYINLNNIGYFQSINTHLNSIECLKVDFIKWSNPIFSHVNLHFNSVKIFELHTNHSYGINSKIPFSFNQLEHFSLTFCGKTVDHNFIEFISKNVSIKKLSLYNYIKNEKILISDKIKTEIIRILPLLEEIVFRDSEFSVYDVVQFTNSFKLLKKFIFKLDDMSELNFDCLQSKIGNEWHISISNYRDTVKVSYVLKSKDRIDYADEGFDHVRNTGYVIEIQRKI